MVGEPSLFFSNPICLEALMILKKTLQQCSFRSTTVGTLHATSLQDFGYGDVVHQFEKRCNTVIKEPKESDKMYAVDEVFYPGEKSLLLRQTNLRTGFIEVDDSLYAELTYHQQFIAKIA